jgi:hypothetical protein
VVEQYLTRFATFGSPLWNQAARLAVSIGAGLVVLALSVNILRVEEFDEAVLRLRQRVRKLLDLH